MHSCDRHDPPTPPAGVPVPCVCVLCLVRPAVGRRDEFDSALARPVLVSWATGWAT